MKKYNEFVETALNEGHKEIAMKYKQDAIDQATRIVSCLQELKDMGYSYYDCRHYARQLEDIADSLETYKERMENSSENAIPAGY